MNKMLQSLFVLSFLVLVAFTSFAQEDNSTDSRIWSKIKVDTNSGNLFFNPNYIYTEPKQVPVFYSLENSEVTVNPNYRPLPTTNTTQSETSIDIHPLNSSILFASANATPWPVAGIYGTGVYWTTDAGATPWTGFDNPPFGSNSGDPAAVIGVDGRFYVGYIANNDGQGIAVSTNNGANWTTYQVAPSPGQLADKNHLYVDKTPTSPYVNRVYSSWTDFGGSNTDQVVIRWSSNFGQTWSGSINLSSSLSPGSHAQGVNINTGPNGEVYAAFAIYDGWPGGEDAIGFAKSTDGGVTWTRARIYGALTPNNGFNFGIRGNLKPTSIRVASFPSMSVDRSGGPYNGYIYITWPQRNVAPAGSDPDIVMIRSTDGGSTWSAPVRVNDDPINNGKDQYYPWCTVDQTTGRLNVVFYDSREVINDSAGVYMATSIDGGLTFENFRVSDANFRPKPISGLAGGYQGDYIGIAALNNRAYPYWADDRTGNYQGWIAEVVYGPGIIHTPLENTEDMNGPYIINANITSPAPMNPDRIKLIWGRGAGILSDTLSMTSIGNNDYTASIPGNGTPSIYNYYIFAEDSAEVSSTSPGGAPAAYYTFEAATDIVPPVITHLPIGNVALIRWPVGITAQVTDNIGVGSVEGEVRVNGGALSTFPMANTSGNAYSGMFPALTVQIGDQVEYRIKATDNSSQSNIAYNPSSGYHTFNIIDTRGVILVLDDDATLIERTSDAKGGEGDMLSPLGVSATLFTNTLNAAGFTAEQYNFGSVDTSIFSSYDVIILSAGVKESTIFGNAAVRAAVVRFTLAGGKTLTEGGEVGYVFRNSGTTTDLDPPFRRAVLNDSSWVSDRTNGNIAVTAPFHPMFNDPNTLPSSITVLNSGGTGWGARDEVTLLPGKPGVRRLANWSNTTAPANGSIIIYNPDNDTTIIRNVFFTFAISQVSPSSVAEALIENTVEQLMKDLVIPVELTSFSASLVDNKVLLNWSTATELNNRGFDIERKYGNSSFEKVGFIPGFGTTTEARTYSYSDQNVAVGSYTYRLKQMDFDGTFSYSKEVNVEVNPPLVFALEQNYPNPFNPATTIKFSIPQDGFVNLSVYNLLGEKVATLVNTNQKAGRYEVNFDASRFASGVYFYSIEAGSFKSVKKMLLMK
jgi:hypothetical protein